MPGPQRVREQGERPPVSQLHFGWSRRSRPFYRTRSEHERIGLRLPARIPDLRLAQNQNRRTVVRSHGQGHADLSMFAAVRSCLTDMRLAGRGFCVFVNGREGRRRGARFRSLPSLDPETVHSPSATHRCRGSRPGPVPASDPWGGAQTHRSADHGARMCSGTVRIGRSLAVWPATGAHCTADALKPGLPATSSLFGVGLPARRKANLDVRDRAVFVVVLRDFQDLARLDVSEHLCGVARRPVDLQQVD